MKKNHKKIMIILSIIMTLIIWINSLMPATVSSEQSGFVVGIVQSFLTLINMRIEDEILSFYIRKFAHFGQFYILGLLYFRTLMYYLKPNSKVASYTLTLGFIVAVIDESIQLFSDGRAFRVMDIGIDFFGVLMSVLCMLYIYKNQMNKKQIGS